jgi:carboxyl-terminal processing protease
MRFKSTLLVAVSLLALGTAAVAAEKRTAGPTSDTYKSLDLFGDVFEQVRANYVEEVPDKKLIEYALNGMLSNLDPHSTYLNDEETRNMSAQTKGEFGGLGIEVTMENNAVKVVSPIDDTPAQRAGVQSGDLIVEIDSKPVMGMTLNEAVDKMRGKPGSEILLTIVRKGAKEPLKVRLVRAIIQVQSVKFRVESGNIGYIRISSFSAQTSPGLKKAFESIRKDTNGKLAGYVLDLRNDPGGLLDEAVAVSDAFLEKGEIVSTRGRHAEDTRRDNSTPGDEANGLPIVVLINGGSASASEIVAGALQDHRRAIVLGTQSFGKGSVQTLFNVPGGGSMRLTTARYYTPSGKSIQGKGITPDIIVEQAKVVTTKDENGIEVHEKDLKGALKNTDEAEDETPTLLPGTDKKADAKKDAAEDYQLVRAVDLLQGISLYKVGAPVAKEKEKAE